MVRKVVLKKMNSKVDSFINQFPLELNKIPLESFRPFVAENIRTTQRFAERELGKIATAIRLPKTENWLQVLFCDYSLNGFGLLIQSHSTTFSLTDGIILEVKFITPDNHLLFTLCKVENFSKVGKGFRIGVRRLNYTPADSSFTEPATLIPSDGNPIFASLEIPFLFRECCKIQLMGIFKNRSLTFFSNDPALIILPLMQVEVDFHLPSEHPNRFKGIVDWIKYQNDGLIFGLKSYSLTRDLSEALGEYFLTQELGTPKQIHELGFQFKIFQSNLRFSYAETETEYQQVLELRRETYVAAGKTDIDTKPEQMGSVWDHQSRILCAMTGQKVVASVALNFPTSENISLRSEMGFPQNKYPLHITEKTDLIEVANLCTDVEYRNGDLLQGMFTHMARAFILSDRNYIFTLCTAELYPLYMKIGFTDTGHTTKFMSIPHHLIYGTKKTPLHAKGISLILWNFLYGDLVEDLIHKKMLTISRWDFFLVRMRRLFNPLAKYHYQNKMSEQFKSLIK